MIPAPSESIQVRHPVSAITDDFNALRETITAGFAAMQAQITNTDARLQGGIGNLHNQVRFAISIHKQFWKLTNSSR